MSKLVKRISEIQDSDCDHCADLSRSRSKIVTHRGNPDADIVIIGYMIGPTEDKTGIAFSGQAGQLLDDIIRDAGFDPDNDFFYTNVTLCAPITGSIYIEHMNNCRFHFRNLTEKFTKFITLGKDAAIGTANVWAPALANSISINTMAKLNTGGIPKLLDDNKFMFCTYHTAGLFRITNKTTFSNRQDIIMKEIQAAKEMDLNEEVEDYSENILF